MKYTNLLLSLVASFIILSAFTRMEKKDKVVYAFGISTSFKDSVVYCTQVQQLDSVVLQKGMLPGRELYSYQLKNYLESQQGVRNYTCAIYFDENAKRLAKQRAKLLTRYLKAKNTVQELSQVEFMFTKPSE